MWISRIIFACVCMCSAHREGILLRYTWYLPSSWEGEVVIGNTDSSKVLGQFKWWLPVCMALQCRICHGFPSCSGRCPCPYHEVIGLSCLKGSDLLWGNLDLLTKSTFLLLKWRIKLGETGTVPALPLGNVKICKADKLPHWLNSV